MKKTITNTEQAILLKEEIISGRKFMLFLMMKAIIILVSITGNLGIANAQSIILGRPTDISITASIMFDYNANFYMVYGLQPGIYTDSIPIINTTANIPDEIELQNLFTDTKYYYKLVFSQAGTGTFTYSPEYSFHTQRAPGSTFTFTVEADEHLYDASMGSQNLYRINLENQKKDSGDFILSLGDIFGDDHTPNTTTSAQMKSKHLFYRQFLGEICNSVPFYVCLGNHEGENDYYLNQTPPNNIATYATLWRKYYYPNPYPNNFYSGDTIFEAYGMGQPENYYSWTWGDALFVVLDIYRDQCDTSPNPKKWNWTLGFPQYTWLTNVLQNSNAKYKFVFTHHPNGQQRGAKNCAQLFEWGGNDSTGGVFGYHFNTHRPGWAKPIHQLLVDNGVNILFQGHDHLFAKEDLDSIVYQEVPMAADSTYNSGVNMWGSYYNPGILNGSGHLRVTVSTSCVNVEYVQAYLPADTLGVNKNRQVAYSYSIGSCGIVSIDNKQLKDTPLNFFPNPVSDILEIQSVQPVGYNRRIDIFDLLGETVLSSEIKNGSSSTHIRLSGLPQGIYFIKVSDKVGMNNYKIIVSR